MLENLPKTLAPETAIYTKISKYFEIDLHPFGCKIYCLILGRSRSSLKTEQFFFEPAVVKLFFVQQAHCAIFFSTPSRDIKNMSLPPGCCV